jgi:hypothetical protein
MAHGKDSGSSYENSDSRVAANRHAKGDRKYKEVISRDNNGSSGKNLPFSFIKPPKRWQPKRDVFHVCDLCFGVNLVNKNTAGKVCSCCGKFTKVHQDNTFDSEESLESFLSLIQAL